MKYFFRRQTLASQGAAMFTNKEHKKGWLVTCKSILFTHIPAEFTPSLIQTTTASHVLTTFKHQVLTNSTGNRSKRGLCVNTVFIPFPSIAPIMPHPLTPVLPRHSPEDVLTLTLLRKARTCKDFWLWFLPVPVKILDPHNATEELPLYFHVSQRQSNLEEAKKKKKNV